MSEWGFYGRHEELSRLAEIFARGRFFFVKVTGRRRIGKTTLIHRALANVAARRVFYVQIPDSGPGGVLSACHDAMEAFGFAAERYSRPTTLAALAQSVAALARDGVVVVLDEFQYFNRQALREFNSHLQREVDLLLAPGAVCHGGLLVLGSMHTEIEALLDNKDAPLFHRVTDEIEIRHLDGGSLLELLRAHSHGAPEEMLFLWTLFEGVPKFYRDCFEQGVLAAPRQQLLRRMFFESSAPLRQEADNWFLKELRGRYDVVLKYIARHPGASHADIVAHARAASGDETEQVAGYIRALSERFRLVSKRQPVFAKPQARRARYYLTDNFLTAWLSALATQVSASAFSPLDKLIATADERLYELEGKALEKLCGQLYEERSRKGVGDFALTQRIEGYWDSADTEIDLVAINDETKQLRLCSCKRSETKLIADVSKFHGHCQRFLTQFSQFSSGYSVERVGIAPTCSAATRQSLAAAGMLCQDLTDLMQGLL